MVDYAHPEVLVETEWVARHLDDPKVRLAESNEDYLLYDTGHIPGAVKVDWFTTLQDPLRREFIDKAGFERLCSTLGIDRDTLVVFYGDRNNWFACYAFWLFEYYGHPQLKILNGGRMKWFKENRPVSMEFPKFPQTNYKASKPDLSIRAFRDQVLAHVQQHGALVDVRSPGEYSGELLHMPNYPQEGAMRGGHIPGAMNIPWSQAIDEIDGTFKPDEELTRLYLGKHNLDPKKETIAYCRIGERSSHTWFVLKYLLGFENVRNYDGSWTEWGNLVGAPIEKG
ncbi:rhodanese-related sulfurtransferase [Longilinea arvoryzae]|uniref:Sulfurtransferase n=1 Tax=Longilinea arvoryzae TaxID=360412 RepID=A0A0S7BCM0_9CHLR|nr:sulfurtransferase [Longilinea arvoryzae]GAP15422.1 rhodanese-related sulfurtransferase [Longilinea arvoryzae]